ncbi:hypothetical protein AVEN_59626-1 [Araneus ventricosus]|uniref:Uncharacterized protein n=1 Tax=Araneus ventricosus TaxID=182803 RepID=A0A4Y2LWX2_ARAVE|nr:hypothetical protein AVEN_59626-1 [Araneus ventricosus]
MTTPQLAPASPNFHVTSASRCMTTTPFCVCTPTAHPAGAALPGCISTGSLDLGAVFGAEPHCPEWRPLCLGFTPDWRPFPDIKSNQKTASTSTLPQHLGHLKDSRYNSSSTEAGVLTAYHQAKARPSRRWYVLSLEEGSRAPPLLHSPRGSECQLTYPAGTHPCIRGAPQGYTDVKRGTINFLAYLKGWRTEFADVRRAQIKPHIRIECGRETERICETH